MTLDINVLGDLDHQAMVIEVLPQWWLLSFTNGGK